MIGVSVCYEAREEQSETSLLSERTSLHDDFGLIPQYEEFGNILLIKRTGGTVSDDVFDRILNGFDERGDLVSYEIRPTTRLPEALCNLAADDNKAGEVLLVIHTSLH